MSDLDIKESSLTTRLVGADELYFAQVDPQKRVHTRRAFTGPSVQGAITNVGTGAAIPIRVGAENLVGRTGVMFQNRSNQNMWWGSLDDIDSDLGFLLAPNDIVMEEVADSETIYVRGSRSQNDQKLVLKEIV